MAPHTKGPWTYETGNNHRYARINGASGQTIATFHQDFSAPEDRADLAVMASSREMLDVIRDLAAKWAHDESDCHFGVCPIEECSECGLVLRARRVLAKAEGRDNNEGGK